MRDNRILKTLSASRESGVFHKLVELGYSPEQIKEAVIELLEPYFEKKDRLAEYSVTYLANEALILIRLQDDEIALEILQSSLSIYRKAMSSNSARCVEIAAEWQSEIHGGLAKYWSQYQLETPNDSLDLEEFTTGIGRSIGGVIEAGIQPLIREIIALTKLILGKESTQRTVQKLKFGQCIEFLKQSDLMGKICNPPPWNISLRHWRNMAQHHEFEVQNGRIFGKYDAGPERHTINLSREEMLSAAHCFVRYYGALNLARSIFIFDNTELIGKSLPSIYLRPDTQALRLATAFATQGFILEDVDIETHSARIVVQDITSGPTLRRSIHSSQFLFLLWELFPRNSLSLEFKSMDDSVAILFETNSDICQAIRDGASDPDSLARTMSIRIMRGELSGDQSI